MFSQCTVRRGRRRGPGGQHRNKEETAIVITHRPTGLQGEATERRSQRENREVALFRLRVNLALQVRCKRDESTELSQLWRNRCLQGRISIRPSHRDFPALLAEALDVLNASGINVRAAADRLSISASQLTRLLKLEPRALTWVNQRREQEGLRPLR
jgi:hypothetical protein